MNRVTLIGHLGQDPVLRKTQNGNAVLRIRMATTETFLDSSKKRQQRTEWHNVVVWGKLGEALDTMLRKGSHIAVEGRLQTRSWDAEGQKRYATDVVSNNVILLQPRIDSAANDAVEIETADTILANPDDDVPF